MHTDGRLADLAVDVAQALYTLSYGASVHVKAIRGFDGLVRVDVEGGVEDMSVEGGTSRRIRQILRVLLLPFLQPQSDNTEIWRRDTHQIALAAEEESQYFRIPRNRVPYNTTQIPLEVRTPRLHKIIIEPPCILLLR